MAMNRQYIITNNGINDPNACLNDFHGKSYKIQELIFTTPQDHLTNKPTLKTNFPHFMYEKDCFIHEKSTNYNNHSKASVESGDFFNVKVDTCFSKTTQACQNSQDKGINTYTECICVATQTWDDEYLVDKSTDYSDHMSERSEMQLTDCQLLSSAQNPEMVIEENEKESVSEVESESTGIDSIVCTYSIYKCHNYNNSQNEFYYSNSISNSLEDMSEHSDFVEDNQTNTLKSSPESEIFRILNNENDEECIRVSYLPAEIVSNMNHYPRNIWDNYRIFEIKKFDEIIKSHKVRSDRRLKAISNRMLCKIEIIGPFQSNLCHTTSRNCLEWYNLIVYANSKLRLEKAINCIQLSFPSSCFNEKLHKTNNKSLLRL